MSQVKVRNLDSRDYVEDFRDERIYIPAGGFVEMGRSEALTFMGQITPLNIDGSGECIQPKKLQIEQDPEEHAAARDQPFRFAADDGTQFRTQQGLKEYEIKLNKEVASDEKPVRRKRATVSAATETASN
jgi:hypothetical protein